MALQAVFSSQERMQLANDVDMFNKSINDGKTPQQNLGKADFLKLLIAQLSYQDPTAPMQDKEFIAQMAQFSSLEQMTSMAADFSKLASMFSGSEASASLGKNVELQVGENMIQGTVKAVTRGASPEIMVNGDYYPWESVVKVFEEDVTL